MLTLVGEKRDVLNLAFTPDGSTLAVGGGYSAIELWDIASETVVENIAVNLGHCLDAIRFDRSGRWLFVAGVGWPLTAYRIWGQGSISLADRGPTFALSPVSDQIVHAHGSNHYRSIRFSNAPEPPPLWEIPVFLEDVRYSTRVGVAFRPDGTQFVSVERAYGSDHDHYSRLAVRDASTGELVAEDPIPILLPEALAVSPTESCAVVRGGMSLWVYHGADLRGLVEKVTNDTRKHFTGIAFHPSGKFLGATSNDKTVKLYDTQTWTVTKTFAWNIGRLRSIAFSPDGLLAAAGSDTGKVVVWDVDV